MPKAKVTGSSAPKRRIRPALTPEARESQMCSLAIDLAEQQLLDGTASSQVITHFLKLATAKEKLEREKLVKENQLLEAKAKAIDSAEEIKALYENAIVAMRKYSGHGAGDEDEYDEDD